MEFINTRYQIRLTNENMALQQKLVDFASQLLESPELVASCIGDDGISFLLL
jgi:hypothetical protein